MVDTGRSHIVFLDTPSVIDLRYGQVDVPLSAIVTDPDGIDQVTINYDRPLATESGSYDFQIIHGWGTAWDDGANSYTASILPYNIAGPLNITHVEIRDDLGNTTTITDQELRDLGFDTSIGVRSTWADVEAPELVGMVIPEHINLSNGSATAGFGAAVFDQTKIDRFYIWFDRDLTYSFSTDGTSGFDDWSLLGIHGVTRDDWDDGVAVNSYLFSDLNLSGSVDIERVSITDIYGNERQYTNAELRAMGINTSLEVVGTPRASATTYIANLPGTITIREGQSLDVVLRAYGLSNHWASYEYSFDTVGGSALLNDIHGTSGSGYYSVVSTPPTNRSTLLSISARGDDVTEDTETAYLTVSINGNFAFADGGSMQVVEVRILDNNKTIGGNGNDVLRGTSTGEVLTGGKGNDTYHVSPGDRIVERTGEGVDTMVSAGSVTLSSHVENLSLVGTADAKGFGNALANRMNGNFGDNSLDGRRGADVMAGGAGDDIYFVADKDDRVIELANAGADTVRSSVSFTLLGQVENLVLLGGGNTSATGNGLANWISGNTGSNRIKGEGGADILHGLAGSDTLIGGVGADRLFGGDGNDKLIGENGRDNLTGGLGADHFVFMSRADSSGSLAGRDIIVDFARGQRDKVDLTAIDADALTAGNQAFDFIGTAQFSRQAGELRYAYDGGKTVIMADVNGDGRVDLALDSTRQIGFIETDFML